MNIHQLRRAANGEVIDYLFLIDALKEYSRPREKISAWLKSGELIRVKKGLYIFGKMAAVEPFSKEVLANLIYGPSAISLTYALSLHGLIPERVSTITSVTNKRNKKFITPIGNFTYHFLNKEKYPIGIELHLLGNGNQCLIATPEKALCDQIYLVDKKIKIIGNVDMENYLFQDLRLDELEFKKLNLNLIIEINKTYKQKNIQSLINFMSKMEK